MNDTSEVKCLTVRVSSERAVMYFERPRLFNLYGLLVKETHVATQGDPESRKLPFIECVWMPAYAVFIRTTVAGEEKKRWVSVDAWTGDVALFDDFSKISTCEKTDDFFPPDMDETAAVEASNVGLQKFILRRRGQLNKPTIKGVERVELFYFPLWVYYYRRRRRYIDLKVLDAVTGKSAGPKARVGVLNAIVACRSGAECSLPGQPT